MAVLDQLEPQSVFRFFEELSAIPHGSGNTGAVSYTHLDVYKRQGGGPDRRGPCELCL